MPERYVDCITELKAYFLNASLEVSSWLSNILLNGISIFSETFLE